MTLFTVTNQERTHIAFNQHYLGNVNSYNNWLTRFVTKLFGKAATVTIQGRSLTLNKNSYVKFLNGLGANVTRKTFNQANLLTLQLPTDRGTMRSHLTQGKVTRLTQQLITSLSRGHFDTAKTLVGQGADVNQNFWERPGHSISQTSYKDKLPISTFSLTAQSFTPVLYANTKRQYDLERFMLSVGGSPTFKGQEVAFTRTLTNVQTDHSHYVDFRREHYHHFDHHGRIHHGVAVRPELHTQVSTTINYQDTAYQTAELAIDPMTGTAVKTMLYQAVLLENNHRSQTSVEHY